MLGRRHLRRGLRFLKEDPWERLARCARPCPTSCSRCCCAPPTRSGYTNYADNVVRYFVQQAAAKRRRRVPRLRLAELGGQHARGDGRGDRDRRAVRRRDLLHRRPVRCRRAANTTSSTTWAWPSSWKSRRPHPGHQGHGRCLQAPRGPRAGAGAQAGNRPADPLPHPRHQRHRRRLGAGRRRGRLRCRGRRARRHERPHLAAQPGLHRRRPGRAPPATPA
jgi:hypothetical protein